MATFAPLVISNGQVQELPVGSTLDAGPVVVQLQNTETIAITKGQPVISAGAGQVSLAQANSAANARVIGYVYDDSISASGTGGIALSSSLEATTAQWDVVTGQTGGLTAGSRYYVDASTAGALTVTAPSSAGQVVAPTGTAISSTEMTIQIQAPVLL